MRTPGSGGRDARATRTMLLLIIAGLLPSVVHCASDVPMTDEERAIVDLTNAERQKAGLKPLSPDWKLFSAARRHSRNMARQGKMAHELDGNGPADRVKDAAYAYFTVGENIGWNEKSAREVVERWMNSPPHRANILNGEFTEIGIGVARNGRGEPYYTQDFGRPQSAEPTAKAAFTIRNDAGSDASVDLPGLKKSAPLARYATGTYSVSGSGELPPAKVHIAGATFSLKYRDGAKYILRRGERGFELAE